MSSSGTIESGQLIAMLRSISSREVSGLLSIQGEQDLVSVTVQRGKLVAADAMNQSAEETLAEVLANAGLLSPSEFESVIGPQRSSGRLASEILLKAGVIESSELLEAVRRQVYLQVVRVLRWRAGNFDWTEGVESPFQRGVEPISVSELLLRAGEELGPEGPLEGAPPDLDDVFELNPDKELRVKEIGVDDEEEVDDEAIWLTANEHKLLRQLDGRQPASLLLLQCNLDRYEVKYGLYVMARSGLIRISHRVSAASPLHGGLTPSKPLRRDEILSTRAGRPAGAPGPTALRLDEGLLDATSETSVSKAEIPASPALDDLLEAEDAAEAETVPAQMESLAEVATPWLGRVLALGFLALLIGAVLLPRGRGSLLLPYPWLRDERIALEQHQRAVTYRKIDQAIRSYYLLFGRYPEELGLLVDLELLSPDDLYDAQGHWLDYSAAARGYLLQPLEGTEPLPGLEVSETVDRDFLLNPRLLDPRRASSGRPLVLLD